MNNSIYNNIAQLAHNKLYIFLKLNNISISNYTFNDYVKHIIDKYNIKVFEHHFDNDLISGVTMITDKATTLSYEKECIPARQNFTKCHEIGHIILEHQGTIFTESLLNKNTQELEADYFASIILMPDIVLVAKIIYQQLSYQQLQEQLQVSNKALEIRLRQFVQTYSSLPYHQAKGIVSSFRANTKAKERLLNLIKTVEPIIVTKYKAIQPDYMAHVKYLLESNEIITSLELPILAEEEFRKELPSHLSYAWQFGRGVDFYYVWDEQKITKLHADELSKRIWLKLAY